MPEIIVKQVEGITFVGRGESRHWVVMDGPEAFGGSEAGTRPMELFLMSLAGCTGADVASLLKKMRVDVDRFEIVVKGNRAEEHPKVYTKIDLEYRFYGDNLEAVKDKIEKAIELSQWKYCSVSAMIRKAEIPFSYTYKLLPRNASQ
ncbi:MAG: OsmC family protein [Calditrichaeota bacterium]|nr:OsmC family protein [Calditrichota bacterium]